MDSLLKLTSGALVPVLCIVLPAGCEYKRDKQNDQVVVSPDGASKPTDAGADSVASFLRDGPVASDGRGAVDRNSVFPDGAGESRDGRGESVVSSSGDAPVLSDRQPSADGGLADIPDLARPLVCPTTILGTCGPVGRECLQSCGLNGQGWTCGPCLRDGEPCESVLDGGVDSPAACAGCSSCCPPSPTCMVCPVCSALPEPPSGCPSCSSCSSCCPACPTPPACDSCCPASTACPDAGARSADSGPACLGTPESVEICDGIDNNCNGQVDEGFDKGPCTVGTGPCQRSGHRVCSSDGQSTVCDAPIVQGTPEICGDGIDNDCDGVVDDGCANAAPFDVPCGLNVGECRQGTMKCDPVAKTCGPCAGAVGPSVEICDGKDNDCNGQVDENCSAPAQCTPVALGVQSAVPDIGSGTSLCPSTTTQCSLTSSGATCGATGWSMSYCLNTCDSTAPWTQCKFENSSLNQFDADNGNSGTLEVKFCLTQSMNWGLSLWYGTYPRRKKLMIFGAAERAAGIAATCYTKYFRPESAHCPDFSPTDNVDLSQACRRSNWVCAGGKWTTADPSCQFSYDNVPLWLTAEDCQPGYQVNEIIQSFSVRYYPDTCDCTVGSACSSGQVCQATSYILPLTYGNNSWGSTYLCRAPS